MKTSHIIVLVLTCWLTAFPVSSFAQSDPQPNPTMQIMGNDGQKVVVFDFLQDRRAMIGKDVPIFAVEGSDGAYQRITFGGQGKFFLRYNPKKRDESEYRKLLEDTFLKVVVQVKPRDICRLQVEVVNEAKDEMVTNLLACSGKIKDPPMGTVKWQTVEKPGYAKAHRATIGKNHVGISLMETASGDVLIQTQAASGKSDILLLTLVFEKKIIAPPQPTVILPRILLDAGMLPAHTEYDAGAEVVTQRGEEALKHTGEANWVEAGQQHKKTLKVKTVAKEIMICSPETNRLVSELLLTRPKMSPNIEAALKIFRDICPDLK